MAQTTASKLKISLGLDKSQVDEKLQLKDKHKLRPTVAKIKDWPAQERPRERLFAQGTEALSDGELLAVLLGSGQPGQDAKALALHLLKEWEGLTGLCRCSSEALLQQKGLGPAKVAKLKAVFELGRRLSQSRILRQPLSHSVSELYEFLQQTLATEREEKFLAILLNVKNQILKVLPLGRGDPTQVVLSIPVVMRQLVQESAAAVIFAHNHPSGDVSPSLEDRQVTQQLFQACQAVGIVMHDHLIVGAEDFYSFAGAGKL